MSLHSPSIWSWRSPNWSHFMCLLGTSSGSFPLQSKREVLNDSKDGISAAFLEKKPFCIKVWLSFSIIPSVSPGNTTIKTSENGFTSVAATSFLRPDSRHLAWLLCASKFTSVCLSHTFMGPKS